MELTGILFIIFCILGFFASFVTYEDFGDGFLGGVMGGLAGLVLSLFICGIACPAIAEWTDAKTTCEATSVVELSALTDRTNMSGSFFLGCGSIDEEQYISYITYQEGKGYNVDKIKASSWVYIDYLGEKCSYDKPVMVEYEEDWVNPIWRFFTWRTASWTTFYVPEGSVLENYYSINLDVETTNAK